MTAPLSCQLLAIDLDGTLLGKGQSIHPDDAAAIQRARNAGIHVAIATGRSAEESRVAINALHLTGPGIFANGAMVADMPTAKTIAATTLPFDLTQEVTDFFGSRGHAVLTLTNHPVDNLPTYFLTDHGPPHRATTEWLLLNKTHATVTRDVPAQSCDHICRLGIVVDVPHAREITAALAARFGDRATWHSIYSVYFDCQVIELFAPHTTKWTGILQAAERLHIPPTAIATIGDDINDIAMLQNAPMSFAMANAAPEIQRHAKRITNSQAEGGVARAIKMLLEAK
ncbi:MAG TPA: HAD family hydrolase [Phycisphaerae bacterium]|nr:HAD family hydrolase [Phycisphaerae bacterium]